MGSLSQEPDTGSLVEIQFSDSIKAVFPLLETALTVGTLHGCVCMCWGISFQAFPSWVTTETLALKGCCEEAKVGKIVQCAEHMLCMNEAQV